MKARNPPKGHLRAFTLVFISLIIVCVTSHPANAEDSVSGVALDADTRESIAGAWIFETVRKPGTGADVLHVARARMTRTDAHGRFRFEAAPRRFSFGRRYAPRYHFYHPSYGLVRVRADEEGRRVSLRPSLRDAHLRQADALAYCGGSADDSMALKIVELVCPPAHPDRFPSGSPRATGPTDAKGRRVGAWIFFRENGSVIARGEYRTGAAIGQWKFEPPCPKAPIGN